MYHQFIFQTEKRNLRKVRLLCRTTTEAIRKMSFNMKYKVAISGIIVWASLLLGTAMGQKKYKEVRAYRQISEKPWLEVNQFA